MKMGLFNFKIIFFLFKKFCLQPFSHTTQHTHQHSFFFFFQFAKLSQPLAYGLFRFLTDGAGVYEYEVGFFYIPHGAIMDRWSPKEAGTNFTITVIAPTNGSFLNIAYATSITADPNAANKSSKSFRSISPSGW